MKEVASRLRNIEEGRGKFAGVDRDGVAGAASETRGIGTGKARVGESKGAGRKAGGETRANSVLIRAIVEEACGKQAHALRDFAESPLGRRCVLRSCRGNHHLASRLPR